MFNYSKRNRIIISIILSIVILAIINFILIKFKESQKKDINPTFILKTSKLASEKKSNIIENNYINEEIVNEEENINKDKVVLNQYMDNSWRIYIPKINLNAPILEGTSQENLRRGVTHFENTPSLDGNVCLAAHNRGYKYNFFQELKRLDISDTITYQKGQSIRTYSVVWKGKIKETDLSYLKDTKDNMLTLITCVENMPEYRLCVQAYEIKL